LIGEVADLDLLSQTLKKDARFIGGVGRSKFSNPNNGGRELVQ
jgi:hypothetical protein